MTCCLGNRRFLVAEGPLGVARSRSWSFSPPSWMVSSGPRPLRWATEKRRDFPKLLQQENDMETQSDVNICLSFVCFTPV